ncbi:MAG: hypothetical protein ABIJ16_04615 [Bacteroidota bacterium]
MKYFILLIFFTLFVFSCRKKDGKSIFEYEPPVSPVTKIIKTTTAIGYSATLAVSWFRGYAPSNAVITGNDNCTVFYIDLEGNYPFGSQGDYFDEMTVVASKISENMAILTIFFTGTDISVGSFHLVNIRTIPVMWDDEKITAVFASQDINFGSDTLLAINLTNDELNFELSRFSIQRSNDEKVAIDQNAWIIDIFTGETPENIFDDKYVLYGGEQNVQACLNETLPDASILQMAIIGSEISTDCIKNPTEGFVIIQNVSVSDESVLGHAYFDFPSDCTGKITLVAGTGNYLLSTGKKYNLNLN